jgi:hypothetical protein
MADDLEAQRKIWETEHKRHKLWRWRSLIVFIVSCVGLVAFFVGIVKFHTFETVLVVLLVAVSIVMPLSLVGTIAFGVSERMSRLELARLNQQTPARNDAPTT